MLTDFHATFAWVVVGANAVAGVWALAAHRWPRAGGTALWALTAVAELTILVEVVVGVVLLNRTERAVDDFHVFYGFVALITVGILFSYRGQVGERQALLYGLGGLFLMGLALRAITLSPFA